jgi:hypothetical protein
LFIIQLQTGITKGYYYWDGSKWLRFNDSSKIFYGNSDPTIPTTNSTGDIFVNNSTGTLFVYNGSNWISQMSGTEILSVKIIAADGQTEFPPHGASVLPIQKSTEMG